MLIYQHDFITTLFSTFWVNGSICVLLKEKNRLTQTRALAQRMRWHSNSASYTRNKRLQDAGHELNCNVDQLYCVTTSVGCCLDYLVFFNDDAQTTYCSLFYHWLYCGVIQRLK